MTDLTDTLIPQATAAVQPGRVHRPSRRTDALCVAGLLVLSVVPVIAGVYRLFQLLGGGDVTVENARFFAQPAPILTHILSVSVFAVLGAFQFSATLRRRVPGWHRRSGRLVALAGVLAAGSGLWMTLFYPLPDTDNGLLRLFRLMVGVAMLIALVLGVCAAVQRRLPKHRAWMIRAYALGMGAGTQVIVFLPWMTLFDMPSPGARAWLMGAGWGINWLVAEGLIRSARRRSAQTRFTNTPTSVAR